LIVDDSNFIREYLRQQMERLGWVCAEAHDGSEAISVLSDATQTMPFEVMLIDVNMPVMNGLDCVKQVRAQGLSPKMKVMMVTTEEDHSFIGRALENGADEFLMKPFSPQSLREKLVLLGF